MIMLKEHQSVVEFFKLLRREERNQMYICLIVSFWYRHWKIKYGKWSLYIVWKQRILQYHQY